MSLASKLSIAAVAVVTLAGAAFAGEPQVPCAGPTCSGACAGVVDAAAQERLGEMVTRQRDELVSLTRTLSAERKRQSELESELALARAAASQPRPSLAPVAVADTAQVAAEREENRRLRTLLDLQREENARLEAKLRTAEKVADLVFRAEDQAAGSAPVAAQPAENAAAAMPHWREPAELSPEKSVARTGEIDRSQQPQQPSPEKSTVWTREAMGY